MMMMVPDEKLWDNEGNRDAGSDVSGIYVLICMLYVNACVRGNAYLKAKLLSLLCKWWENK